MPTYTAFYPWNCTAPAFLTQGMALAGYIAEDGKISQVCVGTDQSQGQAAYYLGRSTSTGDFHGQAPVLWFAWALLQE